MAERSLDSIFWIEIEKIHPNPFQPRTEFNEDRLRDLADSIRQYGILQPLVVTRKEYELPEGGLAVGYELIAGERRLRAAKIASLTQVPALIRSGEDTDKLKLEMAIIENLQREDLNPVERAQAFMRLVADFGLKHGEIAKRVGRSREYVSNTMRILALPAEMLEAIASRQITEGHTKPILMLSDRRDEQMTLFKEIIYKGLTVRDAEAIARRIAYDRVRKREKMVEPAIVEMEEKLTEKIGTRVRVEKRDNNTGGRVTIDFFSNNDLQKILGLLAGTEDDSYDEWVPAQTKEEPPASPETGEEGDSQATPADPTVPSAENISVEKKDTPNEDDLYFIKNFSI